MGKRSGKGYFLSRGSLAQVLREIACHSMSQHAGNLATALHILTKPYQWTQVFASPE